MDETRRVAPSRRDRRGPGGRPKCSFCGRSQGETSALASGPGWVKICNGCAYGARGARSKGPGKPRRCSFCERKAADVEWIYGGSLVAICNECTDRCLDEMLGDSG